MSSKSKNDKAKGGYEPWRNRERHYCELCNAWMGSDRQSILLHENGKKHKENAAKAQQQQRQDRAQQEREAQTLQKSLQAMEAAAQQSYIQQDMGQFALNVKPVSGSAAAALNNNSNNIQNDDSKNSNKRQMKQEKKDWESRKKHRQDEQARKRSENNDNDNDNEQDASSFSTNRKRPKIGDKEGYYTVENVSISSSETKTSTTYLEGIVFGDLLEEDMPVQIWIGSPSATPAEQQLIQYHHLWLDGIVAAVREKRNATKHQDRKVIDVAYLQQSNDKEETLETSVPLSRIRIVLGNNDNDSSNHNEASSMIPTTLQEARIMAMGGEVEEPAETDHSNSVTLVMDEATGLSSWSTVSVKRTTVRQELREERERLRQARRETTAQEEREQKQAAHRKMEEAKIANADDSALGAYDVWSRRDGYKGVDIYAASNDNSNGATNNSTLGKKLAAEGETVAFKKTSTAFQKNRKKKKQNRRTTSADD